MVVVAAVATTVCTARHRPQLAIDADVEPTVADGFVTDDAAVLPDYDAAIDVLRRLQDASR